jgi:hypothetical protein
MTWSWILVGWLLILLGMFPLLAGIYLENDAGFNSDWYNSFPMTLLLVLGGLGVMGSGILLLIGIWYYT